MCALCCKSFNGCFEIPRFIGVVNQVAKLCFNVRCCQRAAKLVLGNIRTTIKRIDIYAKQRNARRTSQVVGAFSRHVIIHGKLVVFRCCAKLPLYAIQTPCSLYHQLPTINAPLPRSIVTPQIFVQIAFVLARHAIQHAANKDCKGCFARTIGLFNNRKAFVEVEMLLMQPAEVFNCATY